MTITKDFPTWAIRNIVAAPRNLYSILIMKDGTYRVDPVLYFGTGADGAVHGLILPGGNIPTLIAVDTLPDSTFRNYQYLTREQAAQVYAELSAPKE
jgi:hypothetical protein